VAAVVAARCIHSHKRWWSFETKNPKPSPGSLVSGAPMETGVEDDEGRWYGGVYEVVVAAHCIHSCER
jgi:hypothetical protein